MKKLIITLLSVATLTLVFTGCGGSAGSATTTPVDGNTNGIGSNTGIDTPNDTVTPEPNDKPRIDNNGDTSGTTITNEFGLNPALGTPPPLPSN